MQDLALTLAEAAQVLDPAITEHQLRAILHALRIQPAGTRHNGRPGHPAATWSWTELNDLHKALTPWLGDRP